MTDIKNIPVVEEEIEEDEDYDCCHNGSEMKAEMEFLARQIKSKKDAQAEEAYLRHVVDFI